MTSSVQSSVEFYTNWDFFRKESRHEEKWTATSGNVCRMIISVIISDFLKTGMWREAYALNKENKNKTNLTSHCRIYYGLISHLQQVAVLDLHAAARALVLCRRRRAEAGGLRRAGLPRLLLHLRFRLRKDNKIK